jgi:hypothetical protein
VTRAPNDAGEGLLVVHATAALYDGRTLAPGRDVVLDLAAEQGHILPDGLLVDDHLDLAQRQAVDETAHRAIAEWRSHVDDALTIGELCLSDIWHSELYAEVFLPFCRIVAAVAAAAAAYGTRQLVCDGLDENLIAALRDAVAPVAVDAAAIGPPRRYPSQEPAPTGAAARQPRWQRAARSALNAVGLPSLARGEVLVVSYLSTVSLLQSLAATNGPVPIVDAAVMPNPSLALRAARRGGWLGIPGHQARRRARADADRCLVAAERLRWPEIARPGLARSLHTEALSCLRGRAMETTAIVPRLRSLLQRGMARAVVLPFDHEPYPRTIVRMAQAANVPTLYIQHGYEPYRVFHTGTLCDFAAVWSDADRAAFPAERRKNVRVVGNLRRSAPPVASGPPAGGGPIAIVLAEHHSRQTAILDRRITATHLAIAVEGLRASATRWKIVVRPHPSDDPARFERILATLSAGDVTVDAHSDPGELLSRADLCIGALSTMTLEAAAIGTRVVMVNPCGIDWSPPLQLDGAVPMARDAAGLAGLIDEVMLADDRPGVAELLQGLGAQQADPIGAAVSWLREIVTEQRHTD